MIQMKKILSFFVALVLVFSAFPAFAVETETNELLAREIIEICMDGGDPRDVKGRDLPAILIERGGVLSEYGDSWAQAISTASLSVSAPANCRTEDAAYRLILALNCDGMIEACQDHSAFAVTALSAMAIAVEGSYRVTAEEMLDALEKETPADVCELALLLCAERQLGRSVTTARETELTAKLNSSNDEWASLFAKMYFDRVGFETMRENLGVLRSNFVDGHLIGTDAKNAAEYLASAGIICGRTDGRFDPLATLTRAELAKLLVVAYETENGAETVEIPENSPYSDVKTGAWYYPYLIKAAEYGLMLGRGEAFAPNDQVTRIECAITLRRLLVIEETEAENYSQYCAETMTILEKLGIMNVGTQNDEMTREGLCVALYAAIK